MGGQILNSLSELEQLKNKLKENSAQRVKVGIIDIDGVLRGKWIPKDYFLEHLPNNDHYFCNIIFGWDCHDTDYENNDQINLSGGYPNLKSKVDLSTFRTTPWDYHTPLFLADFAEAGFPHAQICPRSLLSKIENEAKEMGMKTLFSFEYEWVTFFETAESMREKHYHSLKTIHPGGQGYSLDRLANQREYFHQIFQDLPAYGIPLSAFHCETGPGCFEASLKPDSALAAADKAVLFKSAIKELSTRYNLSASFMAKWDENLPGQGGHLHQSLWDSKSGINLFYQEQAQAQNQTQANGMGNFLESYLAGILYCLPHLFPLYAPTINSYKRFRHEEFAPINGSWGIDNRTVALRVLPGTKQSARLENRIPGSDANPYLVLAASLASGLYGIKKRMKITDSSLFQRTDSNAYENSQNWNFPEDLPTATKQMKGSQVAREILGEVFVKHFVQTREWEIKKFRESVSDWERRRYLEII